MNDVQSSGLCNACWAERKKTILFCSENVLCHVQQRIYQKGNFSSYWCPYLGMAAPNGGAFLINFFHIQVHHSSDVANFYPGGKEKPLKIPGWFPITRQKRHCNTFSTRVPQKERQHFILSASAFSPWINLKSMLCMDFQWLSQALASVKMTLPLLL